MEPTTQKVVPQTGLILDVPSPSLWWLGGETGIELKAENENADWRDYEPTPEEQANMFVFDTKACATFSFHNVIETWLRWAIANGKLNAAQLDFLKTRGYMDASGNVNFSDKFIAILSGTTQNGNTLQRVCETGHNVGLIPESVLPWKGETTWEAWHNPQQITPAMLALGKEFLKYFEIQFEMAFFDEEKSFPKETIEKIEKSLQQAPLQVAIPRPAYHAIEMTRMENKKGYTLFDSYKPFRREKRWPKTSSEDVHYGMRIILKQKELAPTPAPADLSAFYNFTRPLSLGISGADVKIYQSYLKQLGYFKVNPTEYFGEITKAATIAFQKDHGVVQTGTAWTLTFAALKAAFADTKMKTSVAGKELIKGFEGLHDGNKLTAILEPQKDPAGLPTIGWGARYDKNGAQVTMLTTPITREEADQLFDRDVTRFEDCVNKAIKRSISQNQFDALVSFAYNIGTAGFEKSELCKNVNENDAKRSDFTDYCKARDPKTGELVTLPGLLKRRNIEADLYGVV